MTSAAHHTMMQAFGQKPAYLKELTWFGVSGRAPRPYLLIDEPYSPSNDYVIDFAIGARSNCDSYAVLFGYLSTAYSYGTDLFPGLGYGWFSTQLRTCNNGSEVGYQYKSGNLRFRVELSGVNVKVYQNNALYYNQDVGSSRAEFQCPKTPLFSWLNIVSGQIVPLGTLATGASRNVPSCSIYNFKIINSGVTIRDIVGVVDLNNETCAYDRVQGTLHYNQGGGSFVAGPDM